MKESCFSLPDGRTLNWYEHGHGRTLVLLHGWATSAAVFTEMAELLGENFRMLIPDLPGHGKSTPSPDNDLVGIAADLSCWLAAVSRTPIMLAGWSLGGMIALQLISQRKLQVERLALIGTTPRFTQDDDWLFGLPAGQVHALARNLRRRFETTLADFFALAFSSEKISPERLREIRNFAVKRSSAPDRQAALGLLGMLAVQDQRDILPAIKTPALVLHGDQDQVAPFAAGRYLAEKLPNGQLLNFSGIGHAPFLSQPQVAAAKIREFF